MQLISYLDANHFILMEAREPDHYNNKSRKSFRPEDSMSPFWSKTPFPPPICKSQGHLVRHIRILGSNCKVLSESGSRGTVFLSTADARDEWIETDLWVVTGSNNVYTLHTSHNKRSHQTLESVKHFMHMYLNKFSPCSVEPWVSPEPLHLCAQEGILLPPLIPLSLSEKGLSVASGVKQGSGRMHLRMNAITSNWFGAYFDIFGGLRKEIQYILCF